MLTDTVIAYPDSCPPSYSEDSEDRNLVFKWEHPVRGISILLITAR
jgi:hypothetical protein